MTAIPNPTRSCSAQVSESIPLRSDPPPATEPPGEGVASIPSVFYSGPEGTLSVHSPDSCDCRITLHATTGCGLYLSIFLAHRRSFQAMFTFQALCKVSDIFVFYFTSIRGAYGVKNATSNNTQLHLAPRGPKRIVRLPRQEIPLVHEHRPPHKGNSNGFSHSSAANL